MSGLETIPEKDRFQWGPIPAVPYFLLFAGLGVVQKAYQKYRSWWPKGHLVVFDKNKGIWYGQQKEIDQHGLKAADIFYSHPPRLAQLKKEYRHCLKVIQESRRLIKQYGLKKLSTKELLDLYRVLSDVYSHFWAITIQPELATYGLSAYFEKHIPKYFSAEEVIKAQTVLTSSSDFSFYQKEEIEFLNVLKSLRPSKRTVECATSFKAWLQKQKPEVMNKFKEHTQEYSWLLNNYARGQSLPNIYFFQRAVNTFQEKESPATKINRIQKRFRDNEKVRRQLIKKIPAGKLKHYATKVIGNAVAWQDDRKGWQFRVQEVLYIFLNEFANRKKVNVNDLLYLTHPEVWSYINGALPLPRRDITARKKVALINVTEKTYNIYTGQIAKRLFKSYRSKHKHSVPEVKGIVGSTGKKSVIQGKVAVLKSPKEASKLNKGDILITELTSPDYIVAMRKASAVVTDHGGLTSHAAIVARELGIPCIVNTKIATQVFKNGDKVEVNANKGIVRKI
ncbi:hypothetical protein KKG41_04140 [Patescibacteria group bacterium]|nr:hypothetical protein [Patescibacteria group bacterium]MBU1891146.1 hypothetical protein [Patescibacteria group bacterium]